MLPSGVSAPDALNGLDSPLASRDGASSAAPAPTLPLLIKSLLFMVEGGRYLGSIFLSVIMTGLS